MAMQTVSWVVQNKTGRRLAVYDKASNTSRTVGYLSSGSNKYNALHTDGSFCYVNGHGWVRTRNLTIISDDTKKSNSAKSASNSKKTNPNRTSANTSKKANKAETSVFGYASKASENKANGQKTLYRQYVNSEYGHVVKTRTATNKLLKNNLNGIYGLPYQFPASVDPKLSNSVFGAIYSDRILSRMPLLIMSPGQVDFMATYDEGEKNAVYDALRNANAVSQSTLDDFISKPGKYYTFKYNEKTYWKYVNGMNRACAIYLGLGDVKVDIGGSNRVKLSNFRWENACSSVFDNLLISNKQYVCFYLDADPTRTETFSNSTTESQLASKVNSFSDIAKEVQFLVGTQTGAKLKWVEEEGIAQVQSKLNDMCDKFLNGSEVFKNVTKEFAVIATGGKLIFPEIWADSEFSQSYDLNIKLRCPNPNKLSWYLDICVPLNHLLAFTMPRSPEGKDISGANFEPSANGYMSPFLVRAFSRGMFNCDMGIVSNLSISKGKEGSWSIDGLPSEVDVSLEIKDLFNLMAMTHPDNTIAFMNNNQYLNYIANTCGISINKPDLQRSVDLFLMIKRNYYRDRLSGYNFWASAKNGIQNKMLSMYQGIFKG